MDKFFAVELPAMPSISDELKIRGRNFSWPYFDPAKSAKIFNLENFRLYGILDLS